MGVDSRDKRASVLGLGLASLLVLPAPGTMEPLDRPHVAYCYRGVGALAPVEARPIVITVGGEDRTLVVAAEDRTIAVPARVLVVVAVDEPTITVPAHPVIVVPEEEGHE